eukprot:636667-Rhodomonas_salina.2
MPVRLLLLSSFFLFSCLTRDSARTGGSSPIQPKDRSQVTHSRSAPARAMLSPVFLTSRGVFAGRSCVAASRVLRCDASLPRPRGKGG